MSPLMLARRIIPLLFGCTAACAHLAQPEKVYLDRVRAPGALPGRLDATMRDLARQGFAGTVLVAQGNRVLLYQGYGDANRARHIPNSAETKYPLGALGQKLRLYQPAALTRTVFDDGFLNESLVARGYAGPLGETVIVTGLVAPLADVFHWHQAIRTAGMLPAAGPERLARNPGNSNPLGWVVERTAGGHHLVQQVSDGRGFENWYGYFPDHDVLILIAANDDLGWRRPAAERLTEIMVDGASPSVDGVTKAARVGG
ncbi:MAG: hypothetical protein ABI742_00355 [Gemmatimonadota bacterium]